MSAVQVRITTTEYQDANFSWYEIFASETALDLADVDADAEFRAVFFGDAFLHANLLFGQEWFYWVRAIYDRGATTGAIGALGSITVTSGGSPGSSGTGTGDAIEPRVVPLIVSDANGSAIAVGDGKAYWRVNALISGRSLSTAAAHLTTASSSGVPTIQIHNVTTGQDMLSTKLTIDANQKDSKDATTPLVVDPAQAVVHTGDELRIDIDVAGTGAKGLQVDLTFDL
jgi:hypothetical protein